MDDDRKKPFMPRGRPDGERKPFGDRKPFEKGPRTGEKRAFGDKKPFRTREDRPEGGRPPFKPRSDRPEGEKPRPRRERPTEVAETGERIAKRLARAGISSRRDAEALIAAGRVRVNGVVLDSPARNVMPDDRIELDNKPIPAIERTRLFLFHKPAGVVTTNRDPEGRRTVFDVLPEGLPRLLTVGRLDINTEGLLLLTNDGGLSRVLELPTTGWLRRYRVRVHGEVDEAKLAGLSEGIAVDGIFYGAIEATLDRSQGTNSWLTIGLREGKNREVKNVLGALGLEVTRLIRISFGPFQLGELEERGVHEIKGRYLRDQLGERLIEESGAVFDIPDRKAEGTGEKPERERREPVRDNPKQRREDRRTDALGRLDTRPPARFGGPKRDPQKAVFGAGSKRDRDEPRREATPPRSRSANVWMAPGARPVRSRKPEEGADVPERTPRDARSGDRPRPGLRTADGEKPRFPKGPRADARPARSDEFRPGRAERARGADGAGDRKPYRSREGKPSFGDRPSRDGGDRKPFRPREDRGAPGEGKPFRPRGERPVGGDKPRGERPFGDKPRGDRPFGDKPRGERKFGSDKPKGGGRPFAGKPKPAGDRPRPSGSPRGRPGKPRGEG